VMKQMPDNADWDPAKITNARIVAAGFKVVFRQLHQAVLHAYTHITGVGNVGTTRYKRIGVIVSQVHHDVGVKWNAAFEKAGFKNAVVMKQMPDNADWDPADIRYNVIRWVASANPSYGPIKTFFTYSCRPPVAVSWYTVNKPSFLRAALVLSASGQVGFLGLAESATKLAGVGGATVLPLLCPKLTPAAHRQASSNRGFFCHIRFLKKHKYNL
jgi:hypothetical protein